MGRKAAVFTEKERKQVEDLAALGNTWDLIALVLQRKKGTLKKHCDKEFQIGEAKGKVALNQTAMKMALSGKFPVMTIFMCKVKLGMRESDANATVEPKPQSYEFDTIEKPAHGPS